jgi:hypothetical protein
MWELVKWPVSVQVLVPTTRKVSASVKRLSDTLTVGTPFQYVELYPLPTCITNTKFLKLVLLQFSGKRTGAVLLLTPRFN